MIIQDWTNKKPSRSKLQRRDAKINKRIKESVSSTTHHKDNLNSVEVSGSCLLPPESELQMMGFPHGGCVARTLKNLGVAKDIRVITKKLNDAGDYILNKFKNINGNENYPAQNVYEKNSFWHPEVISVALKNLGYSFKRVDKDRVMLSSLFIQKDRKFIIDGILNKKYWTGTKYKEMDPLDTTHPREEPKKWRHTTACKGKGNDAILWDEMIVGKKNRINLNALHLKDNSNEIIKTKGYMRDILVVYEISTCK